MVDEKMTFIKLNVQQSIWSKLSQLKSNHRIANAYLFSGSRGSGKEAIALKFATYVNCTAVDGPCGECASCRRFRFLQHEHLKLIVPMPREVKSSGNADVAALLDESRLRQKIHFIKSLCQKPTRFQSVILGNYRETCTLNQYKLVAR